MSDPHKPQPTFTPSAEQMALWPEVSGNTINGLGEQQPRRPSPIYWHEPERTPHGRLQLWFREHNYTPAMAEAAKRRSTILEEPLPKIAPSQKEGTAESWTRGVKAIARENGADLVGITTVRPEWVFEGFEVPYRFVVMIGVAHDYDRLETAPSETALVEIIDQYARGNKVAKAVAGWIRERGWDAHPHGGPDAGSMLLIPPAIECGFGELGKHGSMINRKFGSNFRLASVLTDLPLNVDSVNDFGADVFCTNCRVCEKVCPPLALTGEKQMVRGINRWYVDFDRCLPYFNEAQSCGICIAKCPWSRPGVADNLAAKIARRRVEKAG